MVVEGSIVNYNRGSKAGYNLQAALSEIVSSLVEGSDAKNSQPLKPSSIFLMYSCAEKLPASLLSRKNLIGLIKHERCKVGDITFDCPMKYLKHEIEIKQQFFCKFTFHLLYITRSYLNKQHQ